MLHFTSLIAISTTEKCSLRPHGELALQANALSPSVLQDGAPARSWWGDGLGLDGGPILAETRAYA